MSDSSIDQRLASLGLVAIAAITLWVSAHIDHWCEYGRETGRIAGSCLLSLGITRLARTEFGALSAYQTTVINTYSILAHVAILTVVLGLHLMRHRYLRQIKGEHPR